MHTYMPSVYNLIVKCDLFGLLLLVLTLAKSPIEIYQILIFYQADAYLPLPLVIFIF